MKIYLFPFKLHNPYLNDCDKLHEPQIEQKKGPIMFSWSEFAAAAPSLAAYGEARFNRARVAFLSTVSEDGSPRVNPVVPVICEGRLLLFLDPASPKVKDLRLDGRYAMHSLVDHPSSVSGEFSIKGRAVAIDDPAMRQQAIDAACYTPTDAYVLFELLLDAALSRDYDEGKVLDSRWDAPQPVHA